MKLLIGIVLVLILSSGCGVSMVVEDRVPIQVASDMETFAIVPPRTAAVGVAGAHHDGILAVEQFVYVIGSTLESETIKTQMTMILENEMIDAGYSVVDMSSTMLTDAMAENIDYSIGMTVTQLGVDTYAPLCGNKTNAMLTIKFNVTDLTLGDVVYSASYKGGGAVRGHEPLTGIVAAVRNSIRWFLSDPGFIAASTH